MSTLFNNNNSEGGYRLRYMEVFNWGTFDGKVYKLQTNCKTSLLTGANRSGKSTLIDALLTILVPGSKRFYNQSSGAESKRERDEISYFWGYFGKTYSEAEERSQTEQLRHKSDNPYSVLLACFQNAGTLHTITLAQVRWYTNGGLKKVFIVSPYQLNIAEHFGKGHFDVKGEWRRKLAKQFPKTDMFDSFREYAGRFSDLFGLKEKALSLFNQTVGIKEMGDLTQFIRQQMLEEPETEEQFKSLYDHYNDLLISHKAIQKDEKQLELLEPVVRNKNALSLLNGDILLLKHIEEQFPFYTDKMEYELLDTHIANLEKEIEEKKREQYEVESSIRKFEEEQKQLIAQKASLNIDNQILLLRKDIQQETEKRDKKKQSAFHYTKLAERLDLQPDLTETCFKENRDKIEKLQSDIEVEYEGLINEKFRINNGKQNISDRVSELQIEISSLLSRKNRIPQDLIKVRERLLELLETGEDELPFAGELIKVKDNCLYWEDSIERVLHSLSLRLLVPEKYNKQVNYFVYSNNLQTKLVYERIDRRQSESLVRWPMDEESLVNKLDIKDSGIYSKWLEHQLLERFNYYCADDLDVFYGSSKAITSNGLIRNVNRHEKDDRPNKWSKLKYTLGWDNKELVRLLQLEKRELEEEHDQLSVKLQEIVPKLKLLEEKRTWLTLIAEVESFYDINWQQHAEKIELVNRQITELVNSSDKYQSIISQLQVVEKELSSKREVEKRLIKIVSKLEDEEADKKLRKHQIQFDGLTQQGAEAIETFIKDKTIAQAIPVTLQELQMLKNDFSKKLKHKLTEANNTLQSLQLETNSRINAFVNPHASILKEFPDWSGDVMNIAASLTSLDELEDLHRNIRNQRLVEHKRRFCEYMDKSMLDALTNYRTWLTNEEDKIREVIEELNVPLKSITFNRNPDTYLQLEYRSSRVDREIKEFKDQLNAAIPNILEFSIQNDDSYREIVFGKIKELITELQREEVWRRKVTDVRNWLSFNAREYSVAENRAGQYHENTASYSGGQKAQLTYAILGAAIAHQFGIFEAGKQYRSLRFIAVDEAFSKLDPENSQFLMEFCAQLNLQLLVVTPLDKINIVEPYINAVHFVEIKNKRNSILYNLTMEEYYERKEEFKQLAESSE
jgi:uncharacterized protein YPO0396